VSSVAVAITVFLTITLSLALGVALGYFTATGILRAFGHRPQKQAAAAAFTTVEAGSTGH
jgi:hypothetical protein